MEEGDLIKLNCFKNGKDEAVGVSDEIEKNLKKKYSFNRNGYFGKSYISNKRI